MNILTFDIEDWFHILDNPTTRYEHQWNRFEQRLSQNIEPIFELLEQNNLKATFFCLGWVARKYPEIIKRIDRAGHEVASHSNLHQILWHQTKGEFFDDLQSSVFALEDITGKKVRAFRAPGFSLSMRTAWALETLVQLGIEIDSSIAYNNMGYGDGALYKISEPSLLQVNGQYIKELPMNTISILNRNIVYSGGGWFRLFPYFVLKALINRDEYVMSYFHPRDFDTEQPVLPAIKPWRKFKSYYGIARCRPKLDKIVKTFQFVDVNTAVQSIDWTKVPIHKIN